MKRQCVKCKDWVHVYYITQKGVFCTQCRKPKPPKPEPKKAP